MSQYITLDCFHSLFVRMTFICPSGFSYCWNCVSVRVSVNKTWKKICNNQTKIDDGQAAQSCNLLTRTLERHSAEF